MSMSMFMWCGGMEFSNHLILLLRMFNVHVNVHVVWWYGVLESLNIITKDVQCPCQCSYGVVVWSSQITSYSLSLSIESTYHYSLSKPRNAQ